MSKATIRVLAACGASCPSAVRRSPPAQTPHSRRKRSIQERQTPHAGARGACPTLRGVTCYVRGRHGPFDTSLVRALPRGAGDDAGRPRRDGRRRASHGAALGPLGEPRASRLERVGAFARRGHRGRARLRAGVELGAVRRLAHQPRVRSGVRLVALRRRDPRGRRRLRRSELRRALRGADRRRRLRDRRVRHAVRAAAGHRRHDPVEGADRDAGDRPDARRRAAAGRALDAGARSRAAPPLRRGDGRLERRPRLAALWPGRDDGGRRSTAFP